VEATRRAIANERSTSGHVGVAVSTSAITCRLSPVACRLFPICIACRLSPVACRLFPICIACCLLPVACCLLPKRTSRVVTILVIARATDPHRQSEALRAALGLTLRGAKVEVVVTGPLLTPLAERAAATLRSFGYSVHDGNVGEALQRADAVEVWT
jgi:hypothetical protein